MNMDYEKAFSDFLDSKTFEKEERALFDITRKAFKAGWLAAGGEDPLSKIIEINQLTPN